MNFTEFYNCWHICDWPIAQYNGLLNSLKNNCKNNLFCSLIEAFSSIYFVKFKFTFTFFFILDILLYI